MVMSMRCILSSASVADSMLLLAAKNEAADTFDNIWKVLVWSFTAMFQGKWPTHSWDGSLIAECGGHDLTPKSRLKAVIWTLSGDMEYFSSELGISKYSSNSPCSWCACDRAWPACGIYICLPAPAGVKHLGRTIKRRTPGWAYPS